MDAREGVRGKSLLLRTLRLMAWGICSTQKCKRMNGWIIDWKYLKLLLLKMYVLIWTVRQGLRYERFWLVRFITSLLLVIIPLLARLYTITWVWRYVVTLKNLCNIPCLLWQVATGYWAYRLPLYKSFQILLSLATKIGIGCTSHFEIWYIIGKNKFLTGNCQINFSGNHNQWLNKKLISLTLSYIDVS